MQLYCERNFFVANWERLIAVHKDLCEQWGSELSKGKEIDSIWLKMTCMHTQIWVLGTLHVALRLSITLSAISCHISNMSAFDEQYFSGDISVIFFQTDVKNKKNEEAHTHKFLFIFSGTQPSHCLQAQFRVIFVKSLKFYETCMCFDYSCLSTTVTRLSEEKEMLSKYWTIVNEVEKKINSRCSNLEK